MKQLILITGAARSGTSMTTGVIEKCGAKGGDLFGPNKNNKRGMFENKLIREGLMKPLLRLIDADPMGQSPLPEMERVHELCSDESFVQKWRDSVLCSLSSQIDEKESPWFYKGAKMCLVWPLWAKAFPEAKWILVRRSDSGIIRSCMRTSFMRAYRTEEGWKKWLDAHKQRFSEMKKAGLCLKEVWPEKTIDGNLAEFEEMIEWLELSFVEQSIRDFIDPNLWRRG